MFFELPQQLRGVAADCSEKFTKRAGAVVVLSKKNTMTNSDQPVLPLNLGSGQLRSFPRVRGPNRPLGVHRGFGDRGDRKM